MCVCERVRVWMRNRFSILCILWSYGHSHENTIPLQTTKLFSLISCSEIIFNLIVMCSICSDNRLLKRPSTHLDKNHLCDHIAHVVWFRTRKIVESKYRNIIFFLLFWRWTSFEHSFVYFRGCRWVRREIHRYVIKVKAEMNPTVTTIVVRSSVYVRENVRFVSRWPMDFHYVVTISISFPLRIRNFPLMCWLLSHIFFISQMTFRSYCFCLGTVQMHFMFKISVFSDY